MLILNSCKNIYIHIHKTGGTSVEMSLSAILKWNDIQLGGGEFAEIANEYYSHRFSLHKHSSASEVKAVIGSELWKNHFSWATVRNPYSRVASLYNYIASVIEPLFGEVEFPVGAPPASVEKWINSEEYPKHPPWSWPAVKAYIAALSQLNPFSNFIRSPFLVDEPAYRLQSQMLSDPETGNLIINRVVKLEELSQRWPSLCAEFGIPATPLVLANETPAGRKIPTKELFRFREDADYILLRFKSDFEKLKYDGSFEALLRQSIV